jgi:trimethylamine--corrinoid protein Co-methyltransferase
MVCERFRVLSELEMQEIDRASVALLEKVGIRVKSEEVVRLLADAGARCDRGAETVKIPEALTRRALETVPRRVKLYNRGLDRAIELGGGAGLAASGHNGVMILDQATGEHRQATAADCARFAALTDALDAYQVAAVPIMPQDVHPAATMLHGFLGTVANTEKHIFFSPDTAESTRYTIEMAKAACGSAALAGKPPVTCQLSPTSPLLWDPEAAAGLLVCAREGVPLCFLPQPYSGMTAPVTIAGMLAQHNAELLSGVVITQAARPGTPLIWGSAWTTFDMKKANIIISSPEASVLRVAGAQMARFYRMPSHTIGPDADAHVYDEQLGWEKLLTTMAALGGGVDLMVNGGLFDSAWTVSLEQAVLDAEIIAICRRFLEGIEVSEDTLALDLIAEVGPAGNFVESPVTLRQLRSGALWEARVSNTFTSKQWEQRGRPTVVQNAAARVREILDTHRPSPLDGAAVRAMQEIIQKFERDAGNR